MQSHSSNDVIVENETAAASVPLTLRTAERSASPATPPPGPGGSPAAAEFASASAAARSPTPEAAVVDVSQLTYRERFVRHMNQKVDRHWADMLLLLSYIVTGLLDSVALVRWGTFVSMQTGNTVHLGLGLARITSSNRWAKSLLAVLSFCFGAYCFGMLGRSFPPRRRWVLVGSFLLQSTLIGVSAVIVRFDTAPVRSETRWQVMVPIALMAFQSSAQTMISRAFDYIAYTSVVVTSTYYDLFADPKMFSLHNVERNRRAAAPLLLLFGAVLGGKFVYEADGLSGALFTAMGLKMFLTLAWLAWRGERAPPPGGSAGNGGGGSAAPVTTPYRVVAVSPVSNSPTTKNFKNWREFTQEQ